MSGGFDSGYAARKLIEEGHKVIGATLIMEESQEALDEASKARQLADELEIVHVKEPLLKLFQTSVIDSFTTSYQQGFTPNPCITCNFSCKFPGLLVLAQRYSADYIATGHYAHIVKQGDRYMVSRGRDKKKDQSYFLSRLPQEILARTLFPLGDLVKEELLKKSGKTHQKESQDVCFLHGKQPANYLADKLNEAKDAKLYTLEGEYKGTGLPIYAYTPGQKKGIGLSGGPWYVQKLDAKNTIVYISKAKPAQTSFVVDSITSPFNASELAQKASEVQIRYNAPAKKMSSLKAENGCLVVTLAPDAKDAIAQGQTAAFYNGELCLGGGRISHVIA